MGTKLIGSDLSTGGATDPHVAALATGGFIIGWTSPPGGGLYSAASDRFISALGSQGTTFTPGNGGGGSAEMQPSVQGLGNGSFVSVWSDTASSDIFASIIDPKVPFQGPGSTRDPSFSSTVATRRAIRCQFELVFQANATGLPNQQLQAAWLQYLIGHRRSAGSPAQVLTSDL